MRGFTGKLGGFMQHNFFRHFLKVFGGWEHDYAHPVYLPSSDSTHGQENDLSQVLLTRPGVDKVKPKVGFTSYRSTNRNSARLFHHVLIYMGNLGRVYFL